MYIHIIGFLSLNSYAVGKVCSMQYTHKPRDDAAVVLINKGNEKCSCEPHAVAWNRYSSELVLNILSININVIAVLAEGLNNPNNNNLNSNRWE